MRLQIQPYNQYTVLPTMLYSHVDPTLRTISDAETTGSAFVRR